MAWSFSRPSAKRAARVLALRRGRRRSGPPVAPRGACRRLDEVTGRRAVRPGDRAAGTAGAADRRGVRRPGRGGPARRPARRAQPRPGPAARRRCCSAVRRWTRCRWPRPGRRSWCRTRTRCCSPARSRELLDVPSSGRVGPDEALAAAQCGDVLDALVQSLPARTRRRATRCARGSPNAAGRCPAASASGSRWPARWSPTPRCWCSTSRRRRSTRTPRHGSPAALSGCPGRAHHRGPRRPARWCSTAPTGWSSCDDGTATAVGGHHDLLRTDPRYRAVVTRDDRTAARHGAGAAGVPHDRDGAATAPPTAPMRRTTMEESA